jgi:hypothetical protein
LPLCLEAHTLRLYQGWHELRTRGNTAGAAAHKWVAVSHKQGDAFLRLPVHTRCHSTALKGDKGSSHTQPATTHTHCHMMRCVCVLCHMLINQSNNHQPAFGPAELAVIIQGGGSSISICKHHSLSAPPKHQLSTLSHSLSNTHSRTDTLSPATNNCRHKGAATLDAVQQATPCLPFIWGPVVRAQRKHTNSNSSKLSCATNVRGREKRDRQTPKKKI